MIYALCEKLWQHNFTIAIVVKLLINGLCLEEFNVKCKIFKNQHFWKILLIRISQQVYKKQQTQKNHKICNLCEIVAAQFYYSHSSKIANQRPLFGIWHAQSSVQKLSMSTITDYFIYQNEITYIGISSVNLLKFQRLDQIHFQALVFINQF